MSARRIICAVVGHKPQALSWVSPPQDLSVNCLGDAWCSGLACKRCGKWLTFEAGLAYVHRELAARGLTWPLGAGTP